MHGMGRSCQERKAKKRKEKKRETSGRSMIKGFDDVDTCLPLQYSCTRSRPLSLIKRVHGTSMEWYIYIHTLDSRPEIIVGTWTSYRKEIAWLDSVQCTFIPTCRQSMREKVLSKEKPKKLRWGYSPMYGVLHVHVDVDVSCMQGHGTGR